MNQYHEIRLKPHGDAKNSKGLFTDLPVRGKPTTGKESFDVVNSYHELSEPERLFYAYFGEFPSLISVSGIDTDKLIRPIEQLWGGLVISRLTDQFFKRSGNRFFVRETQYVLEGGTVIELTPTRMKLLHLPGKLEEAQDRIARLKTWMRAPRKESATHIHVVVPGNRELDTETVSLPKVRLNLETHYNDDLLPTHRTIITELRKKGQSGLYLFHGAPGTGKTTYIRHLIHQMHKKVIFLPPGMLPATEGPAMSKFLIGNTDTVFVMEDAEEMLVSRDQAHNSGMSTLLNLTDGLMGQALGIQFIASFNTDRNRIDKALLRNGRLRMMYEFKPLAAEKSRRLLAALGYADAMVESDMSLADIFHYGENNGAVSMQRAAVGFGR
ncbi:MAG: AAA family ATPase [Chitinophagia bacterium]|nr:AAA family ATPase [Chitinophagia bacterium]